MSRYDTYERTWGPLLPHLFQRADRHHPQVLSPQRVRDLLDRLAASAGIADVDGTPLRFTPHDFRRVFSTETVNSGLPIRIAARLPGHLDLNTTQGYVAVYPEEVIRHYRRFIADRRTLRPSEEYREPTDSGWAEFRDHFSLRKVALGTCHRPYGTPCQHEHGSSGARYSGWTPPRSPGCCRSRPIPASGSTRPAACNGPARSPP